MANSLCGAREKGITIHGPEAQTKNIMNMKTAFALLFTLLLMGAATSAQNESTFTGDINDRACARAGSHDAMNKRHGPQNDKDCIIACVKAGRKYALVDDATKGIYLLDDQQKPRGVRGDEGDDHRDAR